VTERRTSQAPPPGGPLHAIVPAAVLQLGSMSVALPTDEVERVVLPGELMRVPLSPRMLAGIAIFSGEPAPVVDLAALVGVTGLRSAGGETAILCRGEEGPVALLGGRVRFVGRLRRATDDVKCVAARGAVEWRGSAVPLIEPDNVLAALRADLGGGGQRSPHSSRRRAPERP